MALITFNPLTVILGDKIVLPVISMDYPIDCLLTAIAADIALFIDDCSKDGIPTSQFGELEVFFELRDGTDEEAMGNFESIKVISSAPDFANLHALTYTIIRAPIFQLIKLPVYVEFSNYPDFIFD